MTRRLLLPVAIAAIAGIVAASATLAWLGDDEPAVDGEFVLDEPGIYAEPSDEINRDAAGTRLPDVVLSDETDAAISLDRYRGEPLIVNFWFSRCAPCRRELRDFAAVHEEVGQTVRFVGVDPFDTIDAMQRFASERGVSYDLLRDVGLHSDDVLLTDELGIVAFPVTLFVDADGRILRQTGEIDADELRAAIEELF